LDDAHDAVIQRAAELAECSLQARSLAAELKARSEDLIYRMAETQDARTSALHRLGELRPGADPGPRGTPAMRGTVMLGEDEAVTLAALLEELAEHHRRDPLGVSALQAAALLRHRVAERHWRDVQPGPADRRETGDTRDDAAGDRDDQAAERDRRAGERDDQATERDREADAADQHATAAEQHVRDLLWEAELRDRTAAPPPAHDDAPPQQRQLDQEMAEANRARNQEDRQAIRDMLTQARASRHAARDGRYADGRDRLASSRDRLAAQDDRQGAARDRQAARADRDQAVIEGEEQQLPWTDPAGS
jgi:hypothetical protein